MGGEPGSFLVRCYSPLLVTEDHQCSGTETSDRQILRGSAFNPASPVDSPNSLAAATTSALSTSSANWSAAG